MFDVIMEPNGRPSLLLILLQRRLHSALKPAPPLPCLLHSRLQTVAAVPWVICFYEAMMRPLCCLCIEQRSLIKSG